MKLIDGLVNLTANLGTDKAKSSHDGFFFIERDHQQLFNMYRSNWVAGKVIDIVPYDMTREWREWDGDEKTRKRIQAQERSVDLKEKLNEALINGRLFGGAALLPKISGQNFESPLDLSKVRRGDLKHFVVLIPDDLSFDQLEDDKLSPDYGKPEFFRINQGKTQGQEIHRSWLTLFLGRPIPKSSCNTKLTPWGDSILQSTWDAVKDSALSSAVLTELLHEAKVDVVKVPNLASNLQDCESENRFIKRFNLANMMKSNVNTLLLDANEDWQTKQISLVGHPEVLQMLYKVAGGAFDIPITRLLGESPSGLNATGEHDLTTYYNMIKAQQENKVTPNLKMIDELIVRSATGDYDEEITYSWNPLHQKTDFEKTDIASKQAQTAALLANTGLIPEEAISKAVQEQLDTDGFYPGLKKHIEELEKEPGFGPEEFSPLSGFETQEANSAPHTSQKVS